MREAFWISVVFHMVVIIALATSAKWMPERRHELRMRSAEEMLRDRELTYLALPPDRQKPPEKVPEAKHLSDKNRIATSRNPELDRKTLEELRAGAPKPPGMPVPQGAPQQQQPQAQTQSAQSSAPAPQQNTNPNGLQSPPQQQAANRNPFAQPLTAGSSIAEASRGAARSGFGGASGDYGSSPTGPHGRIGSNLDVLSDTQGVDFGPYLNRVIQNVRTNWYSLVPESAQAPLYKRGKVSIEFAILPDGKIAGMRLTGPSGDVALDRAAWGGISLSNPFPPLPGQFKGPYLALRFHFYYNPQQGEMLQ